MSTSTVFTNNRSQAVRLPADARLPPHVKRLEVRVRGAERMARQMRFPSSSQVALLGLELFDRRRVVRLCRCRRFRDLLKR